MYQQIGRAERMDILEENRRTHYLYPPPKTQKQMKQISAIIERASDGTYSVYCKNEIFSGMGDTIEEAKADMLQQMEIYKATAKEEGFKYPEFLDGEFTITYTVDA